MACDNVNSKNKKYHKCNDCRNDLKYEYSQLYFLMNPFLLVTTPVMVCPFGICSINNNFTPKI